MTVIKRQKVLVVDDMQNNIDILYNILCNEYDVMAANSGRVAINIALKIKPDIILLDIIMPEMNGYEVCAAIKTNPLAKDIPVIFVTAKDQIIDIARGFDLGAVDYITKPIYPLLVKARIKTHLALYNQKRELLKEVMVKTHELNESRLDVIKKLGIAVEYKDRGTGMHVARMGEYCYNIARAYGLNEQESKLIANASPMHDIGKIGIPDNIILKPGKLDEREWEIMKEHCLIGANIIGEQHNKLMKAAYIISLQHHEKWDGLGYPYGLKGEEISIYARIVAIADVFDALISNRPYKKAWPLDRAINYIVEESGGQFDPEVISSFKNTLSEIHRISKKYHD